ncbi:hypothetical protein Anapl_05362 [Anas platyrhynchos]|uniref:Uncharacterized protein n=1 Tax=Anas platyrhynchos TaxID=8839 RepID=R0JY27_ANAPL|nr:hypothetical protein Anapl_05362 [Anas platyrhynchos]
MEFTGFLAFGKTVTAYKAMDEQTPSLLRDLGLHASVAYSSMIMRDMRVVKVHSYEWPLCKRESVMEISSLEKARSVTESKLAASIPKTQISLIIVTE